MNKREYILDIETNGLLESLTTIHSICAIECSSGDLLSYTDHDYARRSGTIQDGLRTLEGHTLVGHNAQAFDIPAIQKLHPWFKVGSVRDTLLMTKLIFSDIKERDFRVFRKSKGKKAYELPNGLIGSHSLKAWGYRIGEYKGDFSNEDTDWSTWTPEMQSYCEQDVRVTYKLYQKLMAMDYSEQAIELEHKFAAIIRRQEAYGFYFDVDKAAELYSELVKERDVLKDELIQSFGEMYLRDGTKVDVPKKSLHYKDPIKADRTAGAALSKVKRVMFNPSSRQHISVFLKRKYSWTPTEFTEKGAPKVDEVILKELPFPEAKLFARLFLLEKRLGQIADGQQAWLRTYNRDTGRIHGRVNSIGAVTSRCTHSHPNMAQVPAVGAEYGKECRSLFTVPEGKSLLGCDASGLELRCLAHYLAYYDKGEYKEALLDGDIHWHNTLALGLVEGGTVYDSSNPVHTRARSLSKTFSYAYLYGAGNQKLGSITKPDATPEGQVREGARLRKQFLTKIPALKRLSEAVSKAADKNGYVKGLDGRKIPIRHAHAALNSLLQGAGAILMKSYLITLDDTLQQNGYEPGNDYEFVANVHDEVQAEVKEELSGDICRLAEEAFKGVTKAFNLKCPLAGEAKAGTSWYETH